MRDRCCLQGPSRPPSAGRMPRPRPAGAAWSASCWARNPGFRGNGRRFRPVRASCRGKAVLRMPWRFLDFCRKYVVCESERIVPISPRSRGLEGFTIDVLVVGAWVLAWLLVLIGLAGTLLPALPGTPVMLAGMLLMAWLDEFARIGLGTVLGLTVLMLLAQILDFLATAEGARRFGAGRAAILGATLGLLVGMFFGIPGMLLGPFVGAVIGHRLGEATLDDSFRAGVLVGTVAKVALGIAMLVWFGLAWWF